jgi:hypothetical protein
MPELDLGFSPLLISTAGCEEKKGCKREKNEGTP